MDVESGTAIRPYHDTDVPQLVELFARVFGHPITDAHWRWKLGSNATPAGNVWLAVADDRPVFQYAGIAQRYSIDGHAQIGMVSVDTMTDPQFRRRGLLTRVATRAYAAWGEGGARFVIGLPNEQWGSRTAALGWVPLFPLQWFRRPLRPEAVAARRFKLPWLRHARFAGACWHRFHQRHVPRDAALETFDVERADGAFDELWSRLRGHYAFSATRDAAWINWRFLDSPLVRYRVIAARTGGRVAGYLAYRIIESDSHVVSLLAELVTGPDDQQARERLLGEYAARVWTLGGEGVATLTVPGTPFARWLTRRGFFAGPAFSVQLVPLAPGLPLERMRDPRAWLLSGADFDVT